MFLICITGISQAGHYFKMCAECVQKRHLAQTENVLSAYMRATNISQIRLMQIKKSVVDCQMRNTHFRLHKELKNKYAENWVTPAGKAE